MRKPTGRAPREVGKVLLTEVKYEGAQGTRWPVELTWIDPPALRKSGSDGRRRTRRDNCRDAEAYVKEIDKQITAAEGKTAFTFNDAADGWIKQQEKRTRSRDPDLSENALYQKRGRLEKARARFGTMLLHDIKSQHVKDWLLELSEHYKRGTLVVMLQVVQHVLKFAHEHEPTMLAVNPLVARPVSAPGRKATRRADVPDRSDMEKLREFYDGPKPYRVPALTWSSMRVAVMLGGSCGMRSGEVCGLRWDRIHPDTGEVDITDVVTSWPNIRVKEQPKTDAGFRKVPLTFRAREIIEQHAVLYKEHYGKPVGYVVRSYTGNSRREFSEPNTLSSLFAEMMRRAGIVKEDGTPKFTFHALRHWCGSTWVKYLDIHRVSKLLGHANASMTLDVYGHFIDDPEGREKFVAMPDWLSPPLELDARGRPVEPVALPAPADRVINDDFAPPLECPIEVPEHADRWVKVFVNELWRHGEVLRALRTARKGRQEARYELRRLELPTVDELEAMANQDLEGRGSRVVAEIETEVEPVVPPVADCPIDLPDLAPDWLRVYLRHLDSGMSQEAACLAVRKGWAAVKAELRRLGLPGTAELKRRMRMKKVVGLVERGYQDSEIARMLGTKRQAIWKIRDALHKETADNLRLNKKRRKPRLDTQPEHKNQFKLL